MSLPVNQDGSTQPNFNFYTSNFYDGSATSNFTSNYTSNISNILNSKIILKDNILTFNSPLTRTNDTIGINLSSYYNKTETDTFLNTKEQILSFTAPLTRTTNTIGINLSSYSTTGSDINYLKLNGTTPMTGTLNVPNITLGSGGKINSYDDYHYIQISQPTDTLTIQEYGTISFNIGISKTQVAKINSTGLTIYGVATATTFSGSGASLNNIPYTALTGTAPFYTKGEADTLLNAKEQILTFNAPLTRTTNTIGINLNSYVPFTALQQSNFVNFPQLLSSNYANYGALNSCNYANYGALNSCNYANYGALNSCNYANYGALNSCNYANYGALNSCNYIINSVNNLTNYYTKTEVNNISNYNSNFTTQQSNILNTKINTKEDILTFNAPLTRSTNTIGINLNSYTPFTALQQSNFVNFPQLLSSNYANYNALNSCNYANYTALNSCNYANYNALNSCNYANYNALNSCNYIINSVNNLTNYTRTGLDPAYLLKTGGMMTGQLQLSIAGNPLYISSTSTTANNCIQIKNNSTYQAFIGLGGNAFGGNYQNNFFIESASSSIIFNTNGRVSTSTPNMIINTSGYVGIGVVNPANILQVGNAGRLKIANSTSDYSLVGTADTDGGTNTRIVISGNGRPSFNGNIDYVATSSGKHLFYTTDTTQLRLTIDDDVSSTGYMYAGGKTSGIRINGNDWGNTFYQNATTIGTSPANMGFTLRDANTYNFNSLSSTGGGYTTMMSINTSEINLNRNVKVNSEIWLKNDVWHRSFEGAYRLYFAGSSGTTYLAGGNADSGGICTQFMSGPVSGYANLMSIYNNGNITMGTSSTNNAFLIVNGSLACRLFSVSSTNTDYVGTQGNRTQGTTILDTLCSLFGTFTGMHRCFTEDPLYDNSNPQKFKDDYLGRIVVSTGKIATDISNENNEWNIYYDKDGITPEDAVPMIELCRKRKDKAVFGVMGNPTRKNSRPERMIINSIGEGPILVINSNGNIENGDYIQSSDYLGYGEKQDDDLLHNYTVAKATMDCSFELDSPYYNCYEIDDLDINGNKLRVAFIASTYHCG
jgi:hypothetical protein